MKKKDWNYIKDRFRKVFYYIREGVEIAKKVPSYEEILADKEYPSLIDRVNYYCKLGILLIDSIERIYSFGDFLSELKIFVGFEMKCKEI